MTDPDAAGLVAAFERIVEFVGAADLTQRVSDAEDRLLGVDAAAVEEAADACGLDLALLTAAIQVRNKIGRINDVIHAAVITQVLPHLLEEGEVITNRPSLAAGNDPSRPFDLETSHRVAEFKVALWKGSDAMRKRGVFADLVHLALDDTDRRKQLFVAGPQAIRFLRTTRSVADWGLNRSSAFLRERFVQRFGPLAITIADFTESHGAAVEIIDLRERMPHLRAAIDAGSLD